LRKDIDELAKEVASKPKFSPIADVEIFHKAVDWALRYDEFFDLKQVAFAKTLLEQGNERVQQLRAGQTPWLEATGLVVPWLSLEARRVSAAVRLVMPPVLKRGEQMPRELLVWLAGRNEKRTELAFLAERESSMGSFTPENAIVLHRTAALQRD